MYKEGKSLGTPTYSESSMLSSQVVLRTQPSKEVEQTRELSHLLNKMKITKTRDLGIQTEELVNYICQSCVVLA